MFKFDNTHIFTGYLKQLLSNFNLPMCRVYTKEFAEYAIKYGKEDPRVIESFDNLEYYYSTASNQISKKRATARVNYLKGNELYNYFWKYDQDKPELNHNDCYWRRVSSLFYNQDKRIPGLTKTLKSAGNVYDASTHEYLGDYLRFIRDYYNINLMPLYNCFNNKICNNLYYSHSIKIKNHKFNKNLEESINNKKYIDSNRIFNSQDAEYRIYAFPVKLFYDYTIAIDCSQEIEMFCGFYKTALDISDKSKDLITKTYQKVNRATFRQPFIYDKLNVAHWNFQLDSLMSAAGDAYPALVNSKTITRWDIANREQDLKLFIKIPTSCKSSIVVLEGDYKNFNDFNYKPNNNGNWTYQQNHSILNFEDKLIVNNNTFVPISKLQLLAFNTGESYPFADKLVEYLSKSTITPIDEIPDNIKRVQKVMSQNQHHFKIEGLWEDKMQKIIYDYMMCSGPIKAVTINGRTKLVDARTGYHPRLGHTAKSTLYDVLGYVDRDVEKCYASWYLSKDAASVQNNTLQNVDIYNGLYDL